MSLIDFSKNPNLSLESRILEFNGELDNNSLPVLTMKPQEGSRLDLAVLEPCRLKGFPVPGSRFVAHGITPVSDSNHQLLDVLNGQFSPIPITAEVSPFIGFSRTVLFSDPNKPEQIIKLGGIGICTQEDDLISVTPPVPERRMGKVIAGTKNMHAKIFEPDGTFTHDENDTILGTYAVPGIIEKVQRHRLIAQVLGKRGISIPQQVLIANKMHSDQYVLGTTMPLSINFSQLGNIEAWALSEGIFKDPLLSLVGTFLRFNMLSQMHDCGLTHNQFTATNARLNVTSGFNNTVLPNDFTDSRKLASYPEDRFMRTSNMPYALDFKSLATLFDFEHTLHLVYKEVVGGDRSSLLEHFSILAGAAIAGYTSTSMRLNDLRALAQDFTSDTLSDPKIVDAKGITKQALMQVFFPLI